MIQQSHFSVDTRGNEIIILKGYLNSHNSQDMETTQVSINRWTDLKMCGIYSWLSVSAGSASAIQRVNCTMTFYIRDLSIRILISAGSSMDTEGQLYIQWKLFVREKEGNPAICNNKDGSWRHYAQWNKSEKDKYHMISLICEILKKTFRYREQIDSCQRHEVWGGPNGWRWSKGNRYR